VPGGGGGDGLLSTWYFFHAISRPAPPPHPQIRIAEWQLRRAGVPLGRPAEGAACCGLSFRAVAAAELARLVAERGGWGAVDGYTLAEEIFGMVVDHLATLRTLCFGDGSPAALERGRVADGDEHDDHRGYRQRAQGLTLTLNPKP
jgi:hypothetical protein